ncbi:transforming acidic coiled-coil-containing protein 3 isoform X2 [Camponotus floridanus]|uniref:transforming acidic coiled-coil-containing protein 3 isoform X2 n=1 Tax=Camponotus floridanus TaxID=104421 RepID=UPI000DC6AD32|nr:transforming acidic coiled-coil-containing protein 3 isoform X2 [Camponotus floridanus]
MLVFHRLRSAAINMEYINKLLHRAIANPKISPSSIPTNGNDSLASKTAEHEVKVRFAREFADVGSVTENLCSAPESLSSASSFHSLSSTLSTKSSSGICPDSTLESSDDIADTSYVNSNIPGLEDLIAAYADIHLESERDATQDLSRDQTFESATDETPFHASDCSLNEDLPDNADNQARVIETSADLHETTYVSLNQTDTKSTLLIQDSQLLTPYPEHASDAPIEESIDKCIPSQEESDNVANKSGTCEIASNIAAKDSLPTNNENDNQSNVTIAISSNDSIPNVIRFDKEQRVENNRSVETENPKLCPVEVSVPSISSLTQYAEGYPLLPGISPLLLEDTNSKSKENNVQDLSKLTQEISLAALSPSDDTHQRSCVLSQISINEPQSVVQSEENKVTKEQDLQQSDNCVVSDNQENSARLLNKTSIIEPKILEVKETNVDKRDLEITNVILSETQSFSPEKEAYNETRVIKQCNPSETIIIEKEEKIVNSAVSKDSVKEKETIVEDLDRTLTLQEVDINFASDEEQYQEFQPQRQSTALLLSSKQADFEEFRSTVEKVTNELLNPSQELVEETDQFVSATDEIFQDPSTFDFLLARSNSKRTDRLRAESLYVKFDPLISNISMLPQGNVPPINEEQNGKSESPLLDVGTPKRNPAIAAIDRLLFYSPLPSGTVQKLEEAQEKNEQPLEEPKSDAPLIADIDMSKELEIVRTTVLQLEEELEKQKKENKEHEIELERQKAALQEKINKMQTQIAQEIKTKTQMTVVVEEYEKSISRLLTERERDRTNFEQEKAKLQEELQAANHHLTNTEAAFNDVHQKYERLKGVVSVYKNNEAVLKESIQENVDTIKTLETRYDQLKEHAMTQLEKANLELDGIRKQNEAETVKLRAMIKKAELKSNSLTELVEQKSKENKELAKILDEVIARVGHGNSE